MEPELCKKEDHWRWENAPKSRDLSTAHIFFVEPQQIDYAEFNKLQEQSEGVNSPELPLLQTWLEEQHYLKNSAEMVIPKRGDLIQVCWLQYRNDGLYIIDDGDEPGKFVVRDLFYEVDDYGSLPPDFTLEQFNPSYFDAIAHNSIMWVPIDDFDCEDVSFGFPKHLFVAGKIKDYDAVKRPYVMMAYGEWSHLHIIGVSEIEEEDPRVYKEKFVDGFCSRMKGIPFRGKNYVWIDTKDPINGGSELADPEHTVYLYVY